MKFLDLVKKISSLKEATGYRLNENGRKAVAGYHELLNDLQAKIKPCIQKYAKNPDSVAKESAVKIVASINADQSGTEDFDLIARLDILTNGGTTEVTGPLSTCIHPDDKILKYLEKAEQ